MAAGVLQMAYGCLNPSIKRIQQMTTILAEEDTLLIRSYLKEAKKRRIEKDEKEETESKRQN